MFDKGRKNSSDENNSEFLENIDLVEQEREERIDELFGNKTFDTSGDRIVIRDNEPRRKVRRRVKKGTKDEVLKKRQEMNAKKSITIVKGDDSNKNSLGSNHTIDRKYKEKPAKPENHKVFYSNNTENTGSGSEFREKSIDWQDDDYAEFKNSGAEVEEKNGLFDTILAASPLQWVAGLLAIIILFSAILTTNVYARYICQENRAVAMSKLITYEAATGDVIAETVESIEAPIAMEPEEPEEIKALSLVLTSVEKDLKIKLIDNEETLVKGISWGVSIRDNDDNETKEYDDDEDGIIHLTEVSAGDYSVELLPEGLSSEYILPSEKQVVSVKAKVEYKVIQDIKQEIKTEKEVNAAVEDAAGNQAADVETGPVNTDTVEWCESTKVASGEEYVEATPDLTKTASIKKENTFLTVIESLKKASGARFTNNGIFASKIMMVADNEEQDVAAAEPASETDETEAPKEETPKEDTGETEKPADPASEHKCSVRYDIIDSSYHKMTYTCNDVNCPNYAQSSEEPHDFGGGDSCAKCGFKKDQKSEDPKEEIDDDNHTCEVKEWKSNGDGTHSGNCTVCKKTLKESCNNNDDGKCSKCGYKKTDANHTHSFSYLSNKDGTHTLKCPCGETKTENCTFTRGKCERCGFAQSAGGHIHKFEYTSNTDGTHNVKCIAENCTGGFETSAKCTYTDNKCTKCGFVNTKAKNEYSDDAQLYDASMNALYVMEGGTYRLAKYSDYKSGNYSKYYRKTDAYLYTGWQTIDGKRYYYKKDNTFVTGEQIIGGVIYKFGSDGTLATGSGTLGIDVSKYQPSINWASVKASGVSYVIIRCGYRGSSTGVLIEDPYFKSHIKGAKAAGLKVGVYFFTTAVNEAEAVEEASMCAYLCSGYGIDYPIFMDCEPSGRAGYNGMSAGQRTEIIKAFCNTIRSAGYTPGVYANKTWLTSYMNPGSLSGVRIWLAQYNSAGPTYSGHYDMWQYTSKGSVKGISGYVDMNQSYMGY